MLEKPLSKDFIKINKRNLKKVSKTRRYSEIPRTRSQSVTKPKKDPPKQRNNSQQPKNYLRSQNVWEIPEDPQENSPSTKSCRNSPAKVLLDQVSKSELKRKKSSQQCPSPKKAKIV